jgi:hypothetical protein
MSVTVTGDTIHDVRLKLSMGSPPSAIRIRFIGVDSDFYRTYERGCIVDATDFDSTEKVARKFETPASALKYIGSILKKQDAWVKEENKKRAKKLRDTKRDTKKANGHG